MLVTFKWIIEPLNTRISSVPSPMPPKTKKNIEIREEKLTQVKAELAHNNGGLRRREACRKNEIDGEE